MADELNSRMKLRAVMVDVGKGKFDILADNEVVFSKDRVGRFPLPGEIIKLLRNR